ncbi:MAG: transcription termination factor Rho [Sphaerochaetaceae bacterium]
MEPMVEANTYNRERQEEREEREDREYAQSGSNQLPPTHSSQQSNNQTQSASYAMRNSPNRMQARNQNQNNKQNQNRQKPSHGKNNTFQNRPGRASYNLPEDLPAETYEDNPNAPRIIVNDLSVMSIPALRQRAMEANVSEDVLFEMKKQEIIVEVLKAHTAAGGVIFAYGSLEILPDGYGFLRSPQNNYLSGPEDIYISPSQIKLFNLKTGDTVEGQIRSPRDAERFFAMLRVQTINYDPPEMAKTRVNFDTLTPLYPDKRLNLETEEEDISTRLINLFCPIGKGQRSLIVAPPRAGKTILMQKIANAISANHPEVYLMVLLIDERPEEVTDMRRTVKGEVIASTFDEQATRHVSVAEMVIEKAKRLVEHKRDVVILLDNITRLARAYNQTVPASGKILSGGVDSNALHKPKRFLGAARNIEFGGSLTIIASALIETGSRMDEVIFEEFKGTGNNEIVLDRRMAERRMFPALNIKKSGTRREDLLLSAEETAKIWALRNAINPMEDIEMTELLIDKMKKTKNNEAFLRSMNTGVM